MRIAAYASYVKRLVSSLHTVIAKIETNRFPSPQGPGPHGIRFAPREQSPYLNRCEDEKQNCRQANKKDIFEQQRKVECSTSRIDLGSKGPVAITRAAHVPKNWQFPSVSIDMRIPQLDAKKNEDLIHPDINDENKVTRNTRSLHGCKSVTSDANRYMYLPLREFLAGSDSSRSRQSRALGLFSSAYRDS